MWQVWGKESCFTVLVGKPKGMRDLWEDLGVGGRRTLRWTLGMDRWGELDSAGSGQGPLMGFYVHGNEPSGSIKKAGCCLTS
jgi:hypothetical protein